MTRLSGLRVAFIGSVMASAGAGPALVAHAPHGFRQSAAAVAPPVHPRFRLSPTGKAREASGWVEFSLAASPFGLPVTRDGRVVYDLAITVDALPLPSEFGSYTTYEAWLATPKLDVARDLGPIRNGTTVRARADWNKFMVFVSAESTPIKRKWTGPIVLVGRSPSASMQSFAGHPFYNTGQPPE
jgi:hypothetical protein